ncbi:NADH dehydrogenase (ubiquinone) Fe-S protein 5 [Cryptococcus wingfieldii CBS 7118]|uniref:NADH dehydrogenase (Ubiquinone) Fe-S protein 5 n=1 Tax=Cryptococcus wingfieldii CBS 7118 TaxID=1295528 RepID=A0A1E3I532_9TREE|nr:NADH dehydrogenase (ubiquinone) Fe-S protein 5 [Cryptococcus wingfieldii CBS 7118]ODN83794.1 NADH dehydrogenase (ubiquinone) Fe-S protein 5 [Cryptococcus wingfieldii CBS 7118]
MAASTKSRIYAPLPFVPQSSLSEPKPAHSTDSALQLSITHHSTWLLVSGILVVEQDVSPSGKNSLRSVYHLCKRCSELTCYANADKPTDCIAPKDDYLECLHNTKEIARAKEVKAHFIQKELHSGSDARKAAEKAATGVVVSLGLVEGEEGK